MKYLKMLGLAAVAAMALMAFGAGTASATTLCKDTACTEHATIIEAKSVGKSVLKTSNGTVLDECEGSSLKGEPNTGGEGKEVSGAIQELNWGTCTKTTHTTVNGSLDISWISGTENGTLTVTGTRVTVNTIFGSCIFTASDIGQLVGGNPAKITMTSQKVSLVSGPCPAEAFWTAEFEVTNPKPLYVGNV